MKLTRYIIIPTLTAIAFAACDDTTTEIGTSLVTDRAEIIQDSAFTITARSLVGQEIMSRTTVQLIGRLDAGGYGSLSSDIVTQFMPAQNLDFTDVTSLEVDSVRMLMFIDQGAYTGDSVMPMGVNVYRLNKQLPSPIYSNFDPTGYYSEEDLMGQALYTAEPMHSDSLLNLKFRTITVNLDDQFGLDLMKQYQDSSSIFYSPASFAEWFPGVYIANSFGNGRVTQVSETRINLYYHVHKNVTIDDVVRDSVMNRISSCLAVTPEVITNNNLTYDLAPEINERIEAGEAILAGPAGADVEIVFPLREILESYRSKGGKMSVFNSLSFQLPVEELDAAYGIKPPYTLLMVLKSKKDDFFANNELTDNKTSFYTTYNQLKKCYYFSGMREYLIEMLDKKDEEITPDDYTFVLTPIDITTQKASDYSTETVITSMTPFITSPTLVKFKTEEAKIKIVFSKQIIENS